jgi:hypothetical protein
MRLGKGRFSNIAVKRTEIIPLRRLSPSWGLPFPNPRPQAYLLQEAEH